MTDEKKLKPNTKIRVGWYMDKYQMFGVRNGIFGKQGEEHKSFQEINKKGQPSIVFWDLLRERYTRANNYILTIIGDTDDISNS